MHRVASAVNDLPEESHQLLQYVVQDDLSYEEVAQQLGIPIGTVRSRISRTRSFLKRRVDGDTSPRPLGACTSAPSNSCSQAITTSVIDRLAA